MKWNRPMLSSIRGTSKNKENVLVATTASDGSSSDSAKEEEVSSVIVRASNTAGEELNVVSDADSTALHRETTGNANSTVHVRKASSDKGGSVRHDNRGKSSSTRAVDHGSAGSDLAPGMLPHRDHGSRDDTSMPRGSHHHDEKRSRRHTPSSKRPRRRHRSSSVEVTGANRLVAVTVRVVDGPIRHRKGRKILPQTMRGHYTTRARLRPGRSVTRTTTRIGAATLSLTSSTDRRVSRHF